MPGYGHSAEVEIERKKSRECGAKSSVTHRG
jgi:hypothetical protein